MSEQTQEIKEKLKEYHLKATHQRIAVLSILMNSKAHPSAEMIRKELIRSGIHMSFATVYNVLDTFVEAGLIQRLSDGGDIMRFDYNTDFHIHLCDAKTGRIDDLQDAVFCKYVWEYLQEHVQEKDQIKKIDLIVQTEE
jgi:Fur family peroxide stress response transcriptional regulator